MAGPARSRFDRQRDVVRMSDVIGVPKFERLFRKAAQLDVDKNDIRRVGDFLNDELFRLVVRGEANAKANGRDVIEPWDLPVTAGLQERTQEFRRLDEDVDVQPILDDLGARPPLDLALSEETEARLPELLGGLLVALARTMTETDPDVKNPATEHWERAQRLFALLL
jgi:hypothetical protein